jgi:hypothetical protein
MSFHVKNYLYKIKTPKGWEDFSGVQYNGKQDLFKVKLEDNTFTTATKSHKFIKDGKRISLSSLEIGDSIDCINDKKKIIDIVFDKKDKCYDIIGTESGNFLVNSNIYSSNCDEFSFVPPGIAEEFWAANYPTISVSKESKIIIISTPNGLWNLFHRIYSAAEEGKNLFKHLKADWREVPGRDEKWATETLKNLGLIKFNQEYEVVFIGSAETLISPHILEHLGKSIEEPISMQLKDKLKIYEYPVQNMTYICGVDVAKGTGKDFSAVQVLAVENIDPIRLKQVAVYNSNVIDTFEFSIIVNKIGYYYNKAFILIENNGEGTAVLNELWHNLQYPRVINENKGKGLLRLGVRATKITKPRAILLMKSLIEQGSLKLVDGTTFNQLADFGEVTRGKYGGKTLNDDLVSALYWCTHMLQMPTVLDSKYAFEKLEETEDVWGILTDINEQPDWSWLTKIF